jgi:choline dehydrogenase-like flavoprotein
VTPFGSSRFGLWIFGTMLPTPRNYVRLAPDTKDEFGLPVLDVHIRYGESEQRNIVAARERVERILHDSGYPCSVHSSIPALVPGQSVHYGGTVRMHRSRQYGMLNPWNRLHAIDNVVVADASCFTTGPEKNPTSTVMAIAARAAHRLAVDLKTDNVGGTSPALVGASR